MSRLDWLWYYKYSVIFFIMSFIIVFVIGSEQFLSRIWPAASGIPPYITMLFCTALIWIFWQAERKKLNS